MKKRNFQKGASGTMMVLFCMIFVILLAIGIEWYRAVTLKEHIDIEIERALNIAVELSMRDNYRRDHISNIDKDIAIAEFYDYLNQELSLDYNMSCYVNGRFQYRLVISNLYIDTEPPVLRANGQIETQISFLKYFGSFTYTIPFSIRSRNIRLE